MSNYIFTATTDFTVTLDRSEVISFSTPITQVYISSMLNVQIFCTNVVSAAFSTSGLGNVRPAGYIRPAKHLNVARELH